MDDLSRVTLGRGDQSEMPVPTGQRPQGTTNAPSAGQDTGDGKNDLRDDARDELILAIAHGASERNLGPRPWECDACERAERSADRLLAAGWRPPLPAEIQLIADERQRVIDVERRTPEHDDGYIRGELDSAAACYAMPPSERAILDVLPELWPWAESWWKPSPKDRVRELVKAGQLIAAEIARLQRAKSRDTEGDKP